VAVHGVAELHELPVDLRVAHLALEGLDVFLRHERIVSALQREHLALDVLRVAGRGAVEAAVEDDGAQDRRSAAGELERARAAEAEAERAELLRVDLRELLRLERVERRRHARAEELAIALVLAGELAGVVLAL